MSREAMQMALEALEKVITAFGSGLTLQQNAITALRQALVDADDTSQKRVDKMVKTEHDTLGSEWAECVKLPIVVHVRNQKEGETHISTREGITPVLPDDLIMRGVAGEEYPIGRELFERTYTFDTAPPKAAEWFDCTDAQLIDEVRRRGFVIRDAQIEPAVECMCGICKLGKREWVGLTDEEIDYQAKKDDHAVYFALGALWAEAKLKEKNT